MANTYDFIATHTTTGDVSSVVFNSIPQSFNDLVIHISARTNAGGISIEQYIRYNNTNYTIQQGRWYISDNSGIKSYASNGASFITPGNSINSSFRTNYTINIFNYSSTNRKVSLIEGGYNPYSAGTNDGWVEMGGNSITSDQPPITQIEFYTVNGTFPANCTFSLYGIKNT